MPEIAIPLYTQPYTAPSWLPGGNPQTLYPYFNKPSPLYQYRRERWELDDGDFIDIDWVDGSNAAPLVIFFHGLEGDSSSHYILSAINNLTKYRWRSAVIHFRGCSGSPNRLPRAYHAGDSQEIDWMLRRIIHQTQQPDALQPVYVIGVSLGGNALLKWLGEQGEHAQDKITAAAGISAPLDLPAAGEVLDHGINRHVYTREFLRTLKPKALNTLRRFPLLADADVVSKARSFKEFDRFFTAPVHGYVDHNDYWRRASSKPGLRNIAVPTLVINARNDPFLPEAALPQQHEVADCVELCFPQHGGHVGFAQGAFPGNLEWLPNKLTHFFQRHL